MIQIKPYLIAIIKSKNTSDTEFFNSQDLIRKDRQ